LLGGTASRRNVVYMIINILKKHANVRELLLEVPRTNKLTLLVNIIADHAQK